MMIWTSDPASVTLCRRHWCQAWHTPAYLVEPGSSAEKRTHGGRVQGLAEARLEASVQLGKEVLSSTWQSRCIGSKCGAACLPSAALCILAASLQGSLQRRQAALPGACWPPCHHLHCMIQLRGFLPAANICESSTMSLGSRRPHGFSTGLKK